MRHNNVPKNEIILSWFYMVSNGNEYEVINPDFHGDSSSIGKIESQIAEEEAGICRESYTCYLLHRVSGDRSIWI